MSLTDTCRNEMQRIFAWAEKNSSRENILADDCADKCASCFVPFDSEGDYIEYGFSTVPQLNEALKKMWMDTDYMQEIVMPCAVGAFKARPVEKAKAVSSPTVAAGSDIEIKDFVYMF